MSKMCTCRHKLPWQGWSCGQAQLTRLERGRMALNLLVPYTKYNYMAVVLTSINKPLHCFLNLIHLSLCIFEFLAQFWVSGLSIFTSLPCLLRCLYLWKQQSLDRNRDSISSIQSQEYFLLTYFTKKVLIQRKLIYLQAIK